MFVLLGCEESQAVCIEFRKRGHEAYSCDLQPCSGGHPEWHFQMDVFKVIAGGMLVTQSGKLVEIKKWDLGIFFPTCTTSGAISKKETDLIRRHKNNPLLLNSSLKSTYAANQTAKRIAAIGR